MQKKAIASLLPLLMLGTAKQKSTEKVSVLISKQGAVGYLAADGTIQNLQAGALIRNAGQIKLAKKAYALLYSNGHFVPVRDAGLHQLEALIPEGGMQKLNFDARFGRYLMAALDLVVHAQDGDAWGELSGSKGGGDGWGELSGSKGGGDGWGELSGSKGGGDGWGELSGSKGGGDGWGELSGSKGGGDGWGELSGSKGGGDGWGELSGSKGGGDGWGDKDGRIVPILPFGKIPAGPVIFQWSEPEQRQSYQLEIQDEAGTVLHTTTVKDNWTQLNVNSLPLEMGKMYAWRIVVPNHQEATSTKVRIAVSDQNARDIIHDKLEKSPAYQLQDRVLTALMEAVVLEEAAHFYEAQQRYEMTRQSDKKNNLVKLMQAAFYLRHQLKPRARLLF